MSKCKKLLITLVFLVGCALFQAATTGSLFAQGTEGTTQPKKETAKKAAPSDKSRRAADPYAKDVVRKGNTIVVSKNFADRVKEDKSIILSKVAIKQRLDESGKVAAYELVEVDRGSVVEKAGLKARDRVTAVNGVPAVDLLKNQESLEKEHRFEVTVMRKGKPMKLVFEIR
jgi:S1-C subfamily serine protease